MSVAEDASLNLSAGLIKTDLTRIDQAIYTGQWDVDFNKFTYTGEDMRSSVSVEKMNVSQDTRMADDLLDTRLAFSVGKIDAPIPINSAGFEGAIEGLSISGMKKYVESISKISMVDSMMMTDPDVAKAVLESYASLFGLVVRSTMHLTSVMMEAKPTCAMESE